MRRLLRWRRKDGRRSCKSQEITSAINEKPLRWRTSRRKRTVTPRAAGRQKRAWGCPPSHFVPMKVGVRMTLLRKLSWPRALTRDGLLIVVMVGSLLGFVGYIAYAEHLRSLRQRPPDEYMPPVHPISLVGAQLKGNPSAPVAVMVISDFICPACGRFALETLPRLDERYARRRPRAAGPPPRTRGPDPFAGPAGGRGCLLRGPAGTFLADV